ncbi:HD domain-containing protein [Candidatus Woesearchaeota archaeon]|nr:HD domain-containing protein [Candidatus Woesearchaeota archaeon]
MNFLPIVFEGFEGREHALAKIKRYHHSGTPVMFYRTNDLIHSRRVLFHLEEGIDNIVSTYDYFDVEFARTLALVHDDPEIITGDPSTYDKERMTPEQLETLAKTEQEAIAKIVGMYNPVVNGHDYQRLLIAAKIKDCLEAQFVSFFDKLDAAGEAWHEVWAGNACFLRPAGAMIESGEGEYIRRLNEFPRKYPDMAKFFDHFPDYLPKPFEFKQIVEAGKPHTEESLQADSGYPLYELWKRTVLKREGIHHLITQVEF